MSWLSMFLGRAATVAGSRVLSSSSRLVLSRSCSSSLNSASAVGREDRLFSDCYIELRAHQPEVLKSYAWMAAETAKHLDIPVTSSLAEKEPHKTRKTLLKSSHGHSKHRVQYEFQTFFWTMSLKNMTESTKDTYLEYIQRNLPEGVSMKVTLTELKRLPDNILKTMEWDRFQAKTQLDEENSEAKEDDSNPRLA